MKTQKSFREIRYDEKRRKILENAARIFAKKGYERASLEEIAGKLKLTKASLYHYIKSKEEMLFLIQMQAIEQGLQSTCVERSRGKRSMDTGGSNLGANNDRCHPPSFPCQCK